MRWLALVVSAAGCGNGPAADDSADAGAPDGGAFAPAPPEPPRLTPCPAGWLEAPDSDHAGEVSCEPWPDGTSSACGPDEALFAGEPACRRIGTACPAGDYATDLPAGAKVLHVMAGAAPGGDGTIASPFNRIGSAVVAASDGDVIALSKGEFDEVLVVQDPVVIWGACVAETRIASSTPDDVFPTLAFIGRGGATLKNVTVSGERRAIEVQAPAVPVRLESVVVSAPIGAGILADGGGTLVAEDLVVRDVRSDADGEFGVGLEIQAGSRAELTRAAVERARTIGINVVGDGTTIAADSLVVRDTESRTSDGHAGHGLQVQDGARGDVSAAVIERNNGAGLLVSGTGTSIDVRDVVVRDTAVRGSDGLAGTGIQADTGAAITITRATIERNRNAGILVVNEGSTLTATDVFVRDDEGSGSGELGYGLDAYEGAVVEIVRAVLDGNRAAGVLARDSGTRVVASDVVVRDTREQEIDRDFGIGMAVLAGAQVELSRAAFLRNREFGIAVALPGGGTFEDLVVEGTRETACGSEGACLSHGTGIGAFAGALLSVTRFRLAGNVLCGLQISDSEIDLQHGEVRDNAIGANVQAPGFDLARLQQDVRFSGNGTDLDSSALPVPDALTSLGQ